MLLWRRTSTELNTEDNHVNISVRVVIETDLLVRGYVTSCRHVTTLYINVTLCVCLSLNEKQRVQRFLFLRYFYVASQPARCWINCTFSISDVGPCASGQGTSRGWRGWEKNRHNIYIFVDRLWCRKLRWNQRQYPFLELLKIIRDVAFPNWPAGVELDAFNCTVKRSLLRLASD